LKKTGALIEKRSLVYELLPRLTVNRVAEGRGRTRQKHRKAKLLEKPDLAQLTHGPEKQYIDKVRRETRRQETLLCKGPARPASRKKSWITPKLQELNAERKGFVELVREAGAGLGLMALRRARRR
jgi:hypothetical protein